MSFRGCPPDFNGVELFFTRWANILYRGYFPENPNHAKFSFKSFVFIEC